MLVLLSVCQSPTYGAAVVSGDNVLPWYPSGQGPQVIPSTPTQGTPGKHSSPWQFSSQQPVLVPSPV